jgi:hypothetical protein
MFKAADAPAFITEYLVLLLVDLEDDNEDEAVDDADNDFFPGAPVSSVAQVMVSLLSLVEAEEDSNVAAHSPPPSTIRPVLH